jgi:hypothetical protein
LKTREQQSQTREARVRQTFLAGVLAIAVTALGGCTTIQFEDAMVGMAESAFLSAIGLESNDAGDGYDYAGSRKRYSGLNCGGLSAERAAADRDLGAWRLRQAQAYGAGGSQSFTPSEIGSGLARAERRASDVRFAQSAGGCKNSRLHHHLVAKLNRAPRWNVKEVRRIGRVARQEYEQMILPQRHAAAF